MADSKKSNIELLKKNIRNVPDFPKPGIQFKDITPLLQNSETLLLTSKMLAEPFLNKEVNYVIGLESRGFIFGPRLAQDLGAGFIPIRKPGKLPVETVEASYELEYGVDSVEMHADALQKGDKVLIHDDLIATGGTAKAATELVQHLGAEVIGYSFIIELTFLEGRKSLADSKPVEVLVSV
ncbi:MAG: adenine phosphoribosyltransferase [Balneolaceae bacterium]|nr:adenine phosphoribosyltransferase [Balneolaceae bacterium]